MYFIPVTVLSTACTCYCLTHITTHHNIDLLHSTIVTMPRPPVVPDDLVAPEKKRSYVWHYFQYSRADPTSCWCMIEGCKPSHRNVKRKGGNTSNLARHIEYHHPDRVPSSAVNAPRVSIRAMLQKDTASMPCSSSQRLIYDKAVMHMIIANCLAFNVVDSEEFVRTFFTISGGSYVPLSRTLLTQRIDELYRHMNETLLADISSNSVSITTDGATLLNGASYLAVTAHYITPTFVMRDVTLMVARMTESHTGEYVCELLDNVIEKFSLENRVFAAVTDNGSNFTKGVRINSHVAEGLRCIIHTLQLSLGDAAEKFDTFLHLCRDAQALVCRIRNSHLLTSDLIDIQLEQATIALNEQVGAGAAAASRPLRLQKDVDTRFNSFCIVFQRLLKLRSAVVQLCSNHPEQLSTIALTLEQWELMNQLVLVLQPVKDVCEILEASSTPSLSFLIPLLVQLIVKLREVAAKFDASSFAASVVNFIVNNIYTRVQEALESPTAQVSMMLDPRVRTKQLPQYNKSIALDALRIQYKNFAAALEELRGANQGLPRAALAASSSSSDEKDEVEERERPPKRTKCLIELAEESGSAAMSELDYYTREPGIDQQACALAWWKEKAALYPTLAEMARVYLAIPASSAPSERVFSAGKLTLDYKRRSLEPDRVSRLVFMKKTMRLYRELTGRK